jgi:hypothetical protein
MGSLTAAGTALAISAGVPATQDSAGYAALTYTEIGGVEKIGTIGAAFNKVDFQPLKGPKQKHKGSVDYGSLQPSMAHDDADAGQTLVRTAAAHQTALYAIKVTLPDATIRYFQVRVFGYPEVIDGADSIVMVTPTMEINTAIVKA